MAVLFRTCCIILCLLACNLSYAAKNVLNLYIWYGEVPDSVIAKFEHETGIKVNYATYDDNETMYAKLKASKNAGYDIVEPSSYYVDRMWREGMLEKIDHSQLSNYGNIDPSFLNSAYDPKSEYCIPYLWGVTGIFVNKRYFKPDSIQSWADLWQKQYYNKVSLLDDPREVFSMALISLGYSPNDTNPEHIKQAYEHLKALLPNIKMFNSDAIPSIFIDEDTTLGMAWNGDIYRASLENPNLTFVFPKDGYVIWVDNFAIPKNAPDRANAYKFLNFILEAQNAEQATLAYGYATANTAARKILPKNLSDSPVIFPSKAVLARGKFQTDVGDQALALYAKYWELLKIGA